MDLLNSFSKIPAGSQELQRFRDRGAEAFRRLGLPTRRHENWRYTSVKGFAEREFQSSLLADDVASKDVLHAVASEMDARFLNLVFVNGHLNQTLSDLSAAGSLKIDLETSSFASTATETGDAFEALSQAYAGQGLSLSVPPGVRLERPVRLLFYSEPAPGLALILNPRIRVTVGDEASIEVLETYLGRSGAGYFMNAQVDIEVGARAELTWIKWQAEDLQAYHLGRTSLVAGEKSVLKHLTFSLGATLARHQLKLELSKPGVHAQTWAVSSAAGRQHVDHSTMIDHQVGDCVTLQTAKSLLAGQAKSVFSGQIRIRPDAQKAHSEQVSHSLLLSAEAEADTLPQMMIEADDVKAAHGATVGHLNEEEMFYLMSRGLSRAKAEAMLSAGFLRSALDILEDGELKSWARVQLDRSFSGGTVL